MRISDSGAGGRGISRRTLGAALRHAGRPRRLRLRAVACANPRIAARAGLSSLVELSRLDVDRAGRWSSRARRRRSGSPGRAAPASAPWAGPRRRTARSGAGRGTVSTTGFDTPPARGTTDRAARGRTCGGRRRRCARTPGAAGSRGAARSSAARAAAPRPRAPSAARPRARTASGWPSPSPPVVRRPHRPSAPPAPAPWRTPPGSAPARRRSPEAVPCRGRPPTAPPVHRLPGDYRSVATPQVFSLFLAAGWTCMRSSLPREHGFPRNPRRPARG